MNSKKTSLVSVLLGLVLSAAATTASAELVVIVNAKNTTGAMTADQVGAIFMGKVNTLPSGGAAQMADQPEGSPQYEAFYSKVANKTGAQVKAAWSRLTFSGKATPPKPLGSSDDVKKFVAANPDGIGYVDKAAVDASVKSVLVIN
jgi:ABC-type phosphate transport system substrate-binding protein